MELKFKEEIEDIETEDIAYEEITEMKKVGEDMIKFCADHGGLGLAGPQVGINKKIIVWMYKDNLFQIGFNPTYFPADGKKTKTTKFLEGCLSYPDEVYATKRYKYVRACYFLPSSDGTALTRVSRRLSGSEAVVFQHETDHLVGKTISTVGEYVGNTMEDEDEENV